MNYLTSYQKNKSSLTPSTNIAVLEYLYGFAISLIALTYFFPSIIYGYESGPFPKKNLILIIFTIVVFLIRTLFNKKINITSKNILVYFFFGFWFLYSLTTFLWADDKNSVLILSARILIFASSFFLFTQYFDNKKIRNIFFFIILSIYFIYLGIALWEIFSWDHLGYSKFAQKGIISFIPTGAFYNENDLASVLLLLFPVLLFSIKIIKTKLYYFFYFPGVILTLIIVTFQGARVALVFFGLMLLIYFIFYLSFKGKFVLLSGLALFLIISGYVLPQETKIIKNILLHEFASIETESEQISISSIKIRKKLIENAFEMGIDSGLIGIGSGNFENEISKDGKKDTARITNAHNFVMELFATNGFIVTISFLVILCWWIIQLWKKSKTCNKSQSKYKYIAIIFSLAMFIPASSLPSSITRYFIFWLIFAYAHSMIDNIHSDLSIAIPEKV